MTDVTFLDWGRAPERSEHLWHFGRARQGRSVSLDHDSDIASVRFGPEAVIPRAKRQWLEWGQEQPSRIAPHVGHSKALSAFLKADIQSRLGSVVLGTMVF